MVSTSSIALLALGATSLRAQGVELEKSSMVLCGSSSNCPRPATIDYETVRNATPEWQTIRSDGVRQGSARYALLMARVASASRPWPMPSPGTRATIWWSAPETLLATEARPSWISRT